MAFRLASAGIPGSLTVTIAALKSLLADPAEGKPAERAPSGAPVLYEWFHPLRITFQPSRFSPFERRVYPLASSLLTPCVPIRKGGIGRQQFN